MNLYELSKVPDAERTVDWENRFLTALADSQVNLVHEAPQSGPDGWPYMVVSTDDQATEKTENMQKLLYWASQRGIGVAVNTHKLYPDFVLTYGMIWQFRETGFFIKRELTRDSQELTQAVELDFSAAKIENPPTAVIPSYVRAILKEFFNQQSIPSPKLNVSWWDDRTFDLVWNLESLGNPPAEEHLGIAEALSWFLPPHYSLLFVSEKQLPQFWDL